MIKSPKIKSPQEVRDSQQNYCNEIESKMVDQLIEQFNANIVKEPFNQPFYIIKLYCKPAAYYDTTNVERKFIIHCNNAGWIVRSSIFRECLFTVTVAPSYKTV